MSEDLDCAADLVESIAGELLEQSGRLVVDAERLLADVACAIQRGQRALDLWRRWFARYGDPWIRDEDGELWCVFCDGQDKTHKRGCIFKAAERLVTE